EHLGLDPIEIRMKNLVQDGDAAATPEGEILEGVLAQECLSRAAQAIGYNGKARSNRSRAVGFSMIYKSPTSASGAVSTATVCLNRDGSVHVAVGSSDVGGGLQTVIAQMTAEAFGIDCAAVHVDMADTGMVPFDHGTYSSRATVSTGLAVLDAADKVKKRLLEIAGRILGEEASNLIVREKNVVRVADGKKTSI